MSILNYLKEQQSIQQLLAEARFDLAQPEQYKFYGLDSLETVPQKSGSCTVQCEGTYIFVFKENLFDMVIDTSITYPMIKTIIDAIPMYLTLNTKRLKFSSSSYIIS